jgi:hypothetical protein
MSWVDVVFDVMGRGVFDAGDTHGEQHIAQTVVPHVPQQVSLRFPSHSTTPQTP